MNFKLIIVAMIMMLPVVLCKFVKALYFLLPCTIPMFLVGSCVLCAGVSEFNNVKPKFTNIKKEDDDL